jgi:GT2 family glycosyltransferase
MIGERSLDLMYLARNRLAFTRETFEAMLENTAWRYVRELVVMDDGSVDGTREWLASNVKRCPALARLVLTSYGSPVTAMSRFIESAAAPIVAKVDNDAVLPSGWLEQSLAVFDHRPELSLLGIEALRPVAAGSQTRSYSPSPFVSGLGLYRRAAFAGQRPYPIARWFGFEQWQQARPGVVRGWIDPAIPVFLLDRVPFEPWLGLTREYVARGWQRPWPAYTRDAGLWDWRWPTPPHPPVAPFSVVILSAHAPNLVACVRSLLENERSLCPERIVVVDDGARTGAEPLLPGVRWVPGERPFVFARNANLGLRASASNVFLWNDDALLLTPGGLLAMHERVSARPEIGLCSAAIHGIVGNPNQVPRSGGELRREDHMLCFVSVYLPERVYAAVGPLDERFRGYGYEDNDYSSRVRQAGFQLAVFDGCIADHSGHLPSTFRTRADFRALSEMNRRLYEDKLRGAHAG